jgi:hypothetical protein
MRKLMMMLAAAGAGLLMTPAAHAQDLPEGGLSGKVLELAIKRAEKHPLGSKENPVRVNMPRGEYAYLARQRCPDGSRPRYAREGSVGLGVYGHILDLYEVQCASETIEVYMDMYFPENEQRPLPGFTVAD